MGKITNHNNPCNKCNSSDAVQIYEDGSAFCFSCYTYFKEYKEEKAVLMPPRRKVTIEEINEFKFGSVKRGISKEISEFYEVKVSFDKDGVVDTHYYPYKKDSYKVRSLPKKFYWVGNSGGLFGKDKFNGGGKRVIVCEGEIDTLSIAEAVKQRYGKIYPVVGVSSSTAMKDLIEDREWLRTFGEVVICFDEDDAGNKAKTEAAKIIGIDKVKLTKLPCNDANDTLLLKGANTLMTCIFDAMPWTPAGIIGKEALWAALEEYNKIPSIPYPECLKGLNTLLKGTRLNEIDLFVAGTGAGKSTLFRELIIQRVIHDEMKVGIVSLEESPAETARKLSGMMINVNPALEEVPIEKLKLGYDDLFGTDRILLLDHQGAITDSSIVDQLEYMCLMGCSHIFIDHITILVSEGVENLSGNEAIDKMMNNLLRLVKRYPVWVGLIAHLRKTPNTGKAFEEGNMPSLDDIRGSGSIKQVSFGIIGFTRNMMAPNEDEKTKVRMAVLKNRNLGLTGMVEGARYDIITGRYYPLQPSFEMEEEF